jgi:Tfp pilus assembly protein PilV
MLEALVTTLFVGIGLLAALRRGLASLLANARRPNVERDHRTGRLRAGLALMEAAK